MNYRQLKCESDMLRQLAVDCFENNKTMPLFVHGNEVSCVADLLDACSEQYNITNQEYCTRMRNPKEWGGGPEIVVLCNLLRRPIHLYGLGTSDNDNRWMFRRMSVFGSPKFDRCGAPIHILSADSRFPNLRPGTQLADGNHFLALFPVNEPKPQQQQRWLSWSLRRWW
jgi:hypothetical protein